MRLTLAPLSRDDFATVAHIAVHPAQERFSGTPADAFAHHQPTSDLHVIRLDGGAVGLFRIDRAYAADHWFARPDEPGLKSFMIDAGRQGQGVGTAAVRALDAYLPARYPGIRSVVLTVNMANPAAIRTYRAGGFVDTGEIYEGGRAGPQLVMRMPLAG
ncbi:MAG: GNAT family N-acetyltransferase [Pseudooceanicola sp.]|nr:GNAT family N-acetyltransferase [Pseudooceanicola sp.]